MSYNLIKEVTKFQQYVELHKYEHIVFAVIDAIKNGKLEIGDKLPSINQLLDTVGYSRVTIDKAFKCLIKQGLVKAVNYKGYFIIDTKITAIHIPHPESLTSKLSASK